MAETPNGFHIDSREFAMLARAIAKLPGELKAKAAARAMSRVRDMARTRVVKRSAERIKIPPSRVRALTTAHLNAGANTVDVIIRSGWIPLFDLGATQTSKGVRVRMRGSYRSAFIAQMQSGHKGVMMREGKARLPIRELFGPNPASDIVNHDEVYLEVLADVIETSLMPRYLHEIDRLLPR